MKFTTPVFLASLAAFAPAQSSASALLPAAPSAGLAPSHTLLFGEPCQRVQLVIGSAQLNPLQGALLDSLQLRHLNDTSLPIQGGTVRLTVTLSYATNGPLKAGSRFDANHGAGKSMVFSANVPISSASAFGGGGPTPWDDPRNLHIPFDRPFPYLGGALCLEIASTLIPGTPLPLWLADGALPAALPVDNQLYGNATQGAAPEFRPSMYGLAAPGERFEIDLDGLPPGMPAILILGLDDRQWLGLPLPLRVHTSAGRGVFLQASLDLALAAVSSSHAGLPNLGSLPLDQVLLGSIGYASIRIPFPFDPSIVRTTLYAQWLALTTLEVNGAPQLHLAATQGLRVPIVGGAEHLDIAFLQAESQDPNANLQVASRSTLRFSPVFRLSGTF